MLKNVFKHKKKDKKSKKNRIKKSSSMDEYHNQKDRKLKDQSSLTKNKSNRSQTNTQEIERLSNSKKKKKKQKTQHSSSKKKQKSKSNHSSASQLTENRHEMIHNYIYQINDYISLKNKRKGLIRYIGDVHFGNGTWFGIELMDGSIGNHDGKVGKKRYFKTPQKSAIFVTQDQIKKILKKNVISMRDSSHSSQSNSSNRHSKRKRKEKPSNSLKKVQKSKPTMSQRPNSAKTFGESNFFSANIIKPKRSVPPPPPHNSKYKSAQNQRNSYSHSHTRDSITPQPIIERIDSLDSSAIPNLPNGFGIPAYSLQISQQTNDTELSTPKNDILNEDSTSPLNLDMKRAKFRDIKTQPLISHRSYNSDLLNGRQKTVSNPIRKNKSYGDELKRDNGLSLEFYKNMKNQNDPNVQKLKYLQQNIRKTQSKSQDLEQLLSATPPSLPPTPQLIESINGSYENTHKITSRFLFKRERSKSDSNMGRAIAKRDNKSIQKVSNEELESEAEDTDIEDMYDECEENETLGGPNKDENDEKIMEQRSRTRPRSHNTVTKKSKNGVRNANGTMIIHDEVHNYLHSNFNTDEKDDNSVISPKLMAITPRAVGTDAFSRIRSRSIQNRLAQKKQKQKMGSKYEYNGQNSVPESAVMEMAMATDMSSIKIAKDVCPFWNPFDGKNKGGNCPYLAIHTECALKHLNKRQYLERLNEDDTIELLTLLFCDSLFVESCVVIEKLLKINANNDEYNTCFGDILEELGRYSESEKYYLIALEINPSYDDAHNNYAMMLHHKLGRYDEAEVQYKQCLSINGAHQVCHTNYAKLLQYTHRYKESEQHFKAVLSLNEANINCQHYFGIFLYEMGRWSESRYHLQKAIELTQTLNGEANPSYHYNYAKLLCDLKEFSEANEQFKYCLELEPENAAFNFEFALFLCFDLKDIKRSIKYFIIAYTLEPHNNLISKKYEEIGNIVCETGLTKTKRRKSSARLMKKKHKTIVEYKRESAYDESKNGSFDDTNYNPCQHEFSRFLYDNFSFGNSSQMNLYLKKFKDSELNDIRYITALDLETLIKDISMKKVHAKIMLNKIEKFESENAKFNSWLSGIGLQEYYEIFEQNGILTFESFYFHVHSQSDLMRIFGDRNAIDVQLIWKKCPKFMRQSSMSNLSSSVNDNEEVPVMDGSGGVTGMFGQEGKQN